MKYNQEHGDGMRDCYALQLADIYEKIDDLEAASKKSVEVTKLSSYSVLGGFNCATSWES